MKIYGRQVTREDVSQAFKEGDVGVAVYGLGKMGLPLAAVYAERTKNVTGVDVDPEIVETVSSGGSHIEGEPGLDDLVRTCVEKNYLTATTDGEKAARKSDVHVVIVPTLVTDEKRPDISSLKTVINTISSGVEPGDLIIVESTVPPRTSADVVVPTIIGNGDVDYGEFGVAFCPERTSSGRALRDIKGAYPKVVGGVDDDSTKAARLVYETVTDNEVITVSDAATAETVKVIEGVYRDVNIALANELAGFIDEMGVDLIEAIEVANTNPYCDLHKPGAGVGGHCIPYYPYFLISRFNQPSELMETARKINDSMPSFTLDKLMEGLNKKNVKLQGSTIAVLGLTYRAGVDETRHSPAKPLVERLSGQGAEVYLVDPVLDDFSEFSAGKPIDIDDIYEISTDAVVLMTAHEEFRQINFDSFDPPIVVVDGRQMFSLEDTDHWVYTIGRGIE